MPSLPPPDIYAVQRWLFKSEPSTFSIQDLAKAPAQTTAWEGVRNYQARNMLRHQCQPGDSVLFYHSSCAHPGIVGSAKIVQAAYPDPTQFDPHHPGYDAKSTSDNPRWYVVDIQLTHIFSSPLYLSTLRQLPALKDMIILRPGNRLSITPISAAEWECIQQNVVPAE